MHKEIENTSPLQNLLDTFSDEAKCRKLLERVRWPDGVRCPRDGCGSDKVLRYQSRPIFKCKACKRQFSVTVGTIFEDSHIPLRMWFHTIYLMCASKKGMSAHQIHRQLGISYRSAWFMCHRIRYAMQDKSPTPLFGVIEADETYVGGKPRYNAPREQRGVQRRISRNYRDKAPVFGILERGGRVRAIPVKKVNRKTIFPLIKTNIDLPKSRLITDDLNLYHGTKQFLPHQSVNHQVAYVTGDGIHIQGIENFWSLLKRGLIGTYHHVEAKYLGCYVDEFSFRFNSRRITDQERFEHALRNVGGRLPWFFADRQA